MPETHRPLRDLLSQRDPPAFTRRPPVWRSLRRLGLTPLALWPLLTACLGPLERLRRLADLSVALADLAELRGVPVRALLDQPLAGLAPATTPRQALLRGRLTELEWATVAALFGEAPGP